MTAMREVTVAMEHACVMNLGRVILVTPVC